MQNIINEQEIIISELNYKKCNTTEELEELKTQVEFKTEQLREYKQKHEVKLILSKSTFFINMFSLTIK